MKRTHTIDHNAKTYHRNVAWNAHTGQCSYCMLIWSFSCWALRKIQKDNSEIPPSDKKCVQNNGTIIIYARITAVRDLTSGELFSLSSFWYTDSCSVDEGGPVVAVVVSIFSKVLHSMYALESERRTARTAIFLQQFLNMKNEPFLRSNSVAFVCLCTPYFLFCCGFVWLLSNIYMYNCVLWNAMRTHLVKRCSWSLWPVTLISWILWYSWGACI